MSLAEIPGNHIRRNGQLRQPQGALHKSRLQAGLQNGDENYQTPPEPSTVRSMLKNTTEIGDVGQFTSKPPRVPAHPQPPSAAASKTQVTFGKHRNLPPRYLIHNGYNEPHVQDSPRQGLTPFNGPGLHFRGHKSLRQRPSFEDDQSHSMTQGSYNSHSLTHRHPKLNGDAYNRGAINNFRPRSPYAYPTRLKRPGYRPSSPALSDPNKSIKGYGQGFNDPHSRTATPLSAYYANRTPSPFHHVINRSDPDLQHYPPYLATEPRRHQSPSITSTRPSSPKPSPSVTSISSSSRVYRKKSIRNSSRVRPRSPPVLPLFYDYTEEFEEYGNYRNSSVSTGISAEQPISAIEPSTYSELAESPEGTSIAELPTEKSPQRTLSQVDELDLNERARDIDSFHDNLLPTASQELSDVPELPENEISAVKIDVPARNPRRLRTENQSVHRTFEHDAPPVVTAVKPMPTSVGDHFVHPAQEFAAESSNPPDQGSASPRGSTFSVKSPAAADRLYSTPEPSQSRVDSPTLHLKPKIPTIDAALGGSPIKTGVSRPPESLRGPSFEGHSRVSTEILSPTPERSITSPSNRDRFSKILSIEENALDEEPLVPPPIIEERIDTPMQRIHSMESWKTSDALEMFRRKRSLYTGSSPLKHSTPTNPLVEASDSDEEPELTVALRQTFCKDDKAASIYRELSSQTPPSPRSSTPMSAGNATIEDPLAAQGSSLYVPALPASTKDAIGVGKHPGASSSPPNDVTKLESSSDMDLVISKIPRKQPSFKSYSPTNEARWSDLPLDFTPLIRRPSEDESVKDDKALSSSALGESTVKREDDATQVVDSVPGVRSARSSVGTVPDSIGSRPTSRPWNQDSNYPWNDKLPSLEVTLPHQPVESSKSTEKALRFKLKVQRASSSTGSTNKLRKELLPSQESRNPIAFPLDLGQGLAFRRKRDPNLSILPGQINSSHDITNSSRQNTRFVDTFETQSPTLSLIPPSPNHEVRSFFSDDSSQIRPKGALRKRFSEFRAKAAAARAASLDDPRGYDRGLLSSALGKSRATGRSSRQSQNTAGTSTRASVATRVRLKMMNKIRLWYHRGEDKVRDWGWKMRYRTGKNRAASAPTDAGV